MLMFSAVLLLMGSCGDYSSEDNSEINAKILKYEQTCHRVSELGEKMQDGSPGAREEYSTASRQMSEQARDLAGHSEEMSTEQNQRMEKAARKASNGE